MEKEKEANQSLDKQEQQKQEKSKVDILIEKLEKGFTELGLKMKVVSQTGSFVYFPRRSSSLNNPRNKEKQ